MTGLRTRAEAGAECPRRASAQAARPRLRYAGAPSPPGCIRVGCRCGVADWPVPLPHRPPPARSCALGNASNPLVTAIPTG